MSAIHLASIMAHKETSPKFRMEDPIGKPSLVIIQYMQHLLILNIVVINK